ncbi:MAG: hypothetical protein A2284_05765 [Deltaproteobacteria bacterium RIFOXYA12_FULL_61_11]|nr:MAG: hypothetical protein A2284_05765 [Deltaproteobacteria bacterium RIFOXYA12_FULL_61_11]
MKKLMVVTVIALFAMVGGMAQAKDLAVGYDSGLSMLTVRKALGENNLDLGLGLDFDNSLGSDKFALGMAAFYLMPFPMLQGDDKFKLHMYGGGIGNLDHAGDFYFAVAGGLQPEYFIHEKVSFETRIGVNLNLVDEVKFQTFGNGMNIVSSLAFKVYLD